ncbi:putative ABC transporter ATP-binding protein [compost metagenome]
MAQMRNRDQLRVIWGFARKYKFSFVSLYLCLAIEALLAMLTPLIIGLLVDEVVYYRNIEFFWRIALVFGICIAFMSVLYTIHPNIWQYLMSRFIFDIKLKLFDQITYAKASFLSEAKTGDLISRNVHDASEFMNIIQRNMFHFFNGIVQVALALIFVWIYSWKAAMLMLVVIPLSTLLSLHFGGRARKRSAEARAAYGGYISWMVEWLKGLREIRLLAAERNSKVAFVRHYKEMVLIKIKTSIIQLKATLFIEGIALLSNLSLYILSGFLVLRGEITLGAFIAMAEYFATANLKLADLVNNNVDRQLRQAAVDRVCELLEVDTEKNDEANRPLLVPQGNIRFRNVSFSYNDRDPVLKNINLDIQEGQHLSIVGASGSGKTTLMNLLLRLYSAGSGEILVDGSDIGRCTLKSIRKNIGIVQQETLLFNESIRSNLSLGNRHCTDAEIIEACDKADIGGFIRQLPAGLDTIVGHGGIDLSGGQKQRLGIARIYLKDPRILVFDEATSALDFETEKSVHQAWDAVSRGRTTITIAHRLTTILKSDKVAVLHEGEIVSCANHAELLETCAHYQKLFKSQYIGQGA